MAEAAGGSGAPGLNQPAMMMRSQEDLRRDIVRQLHDGPAQSLANIGLQAEIVERLVQKEDARAVEEIESLRRLVQQALDATKDGAGIRVTLRREIYDDIETNCSEDDQMEFALRIWEMPEEELLTIENIGVTE